MRPLLLVLAGALLLSACAKPGEPSTDAAPVAASATPDSAASVDPPPTARLRERAAHIVLPVPVATGPGDGPISAKSLALRPETVQKAIVGALGEGAAGVDVSVDRGIVHLSGEVQTEADYQRANYVARAVDGVIEIDQSQLRVAR
ncbi:BON domain-containing protein [Lysobacter xanthus]